MPPVSSLIAGRDYPAGKAANRAPIGRTFEETFPPLTSG
jgi:hypothetical protein